MKLASIRHADRERVVVAVDDAHVIDANDLLSYSTGRRAAVTDMLSLIERGPALLPELAAALAAFRRVPDASLLIPAAQVTWRPPVRRPGKICGVAMNNSASNSRKISAPSHPAFFLKPASCLVGHLQPIRIHDYYGSTHPEPELAVIIGRRAREVSVAEAPDAVFGYSIFNDITSNGMRAEDLFHYYALYASKDDPDKLERVEQHLSYAGRYKGSDTFGPLGPWLVTRDEVADPQALEMWLDVNGTRMQSGNTRTMIFGVKKLVSYCSHYMTLMPGDVIATGTPPGVGMGKKPEPVWLKPGDVVTLGIQGLGEQRQKVVAAR